MSALANTWGVRMTAGEPVAVVRVRNVQTSLPATTTAASAHDAWARAGRGQPLLVSAEVGLSAPFPEASADDRVADDTVHYGILSKAILRSVEALSGKDASGQDSVDGPSSSSGLYGVLDAIWTDLTGFRLDGQQSAKETSKKPVLDMSRVQLLAVSLHLPKASLVGDGVSLTATATPKTSRTAIALRLHRLRVPTLIGVHPHERQAKQAVVADVIVDRYGEQVDGYATLEALVVKILDTSEYETLEALATHIAKNVLASKNASSAGWQVHVALEKPIAVPFADAPVVEVRMGSDSRS
ncbi:serine/threonine-protein kinase psk1 [Grosmannia clavigera kw1407]|uniref:dihydroneopterin aldolase n=1 Tax=Grosmannia clavigera (strain kw1407 / UAMH 11150) TaxID=655863 RepID=F0XKV5_GROCL|nr:serine/threonine-protein kinase psk1 [Grosmannia clavigera kw1407]EFX01713.1 serine/threonine-protein kinase psk1 [Grosmannia clavigera kw1407]